MKRIKRSQRFVVYVLTCVGLVMPPQIVHAERPVSSRPTLSAVDIMLGSSGLLVGRVVDRQGRGVAKSQVTVLHGKSIVSHVETDNEGNFRVMNLKGGVHHLVTKDGTAILRLWSPGTAPPSAKSIALVISDQKIAAGQFAPMKYWLADPLVIAGLAAVAIAVPVLIHNHRLDRDRLGS